MNLYRVTRCQQQVAQQYFTAGKAYLCMGQLDEADSQYKRALELEPSSAAIKGEAQLVDMIRSNLKLGQERLQAGDARCALHKPTSLSGSPNYSPCSRFF